MAWTPAKDISRYQGNWQDTGEPIVMIKVGGGDDGLYFDPDCTQDYNGAKADGRAPGLYWFFGGNPTPEAAFFCKGMQPYAEGDVPAIDVEKSSAYDPFTDPNVVSKVSEFIDYVEAQGFSGGLAYLPLALLNMHDWTPVLSRWGLWLPDWAVSPDANIPTHYTYVMQQYSDGPNYDHDAWFGTVDQFKAYGYHAPQPAPAPAPVPAPAPTPAPVTETPSEPTQPTTPVPAQPGEPTTTPPTPPAPSDPQTPTPTDTPQQTPTTPPTAVKKASLIARLWDKLLRFFDIRI